MSATGRRSRADVVGQVEREPAVPVAERLDAAPHDFARRGQRVEIGRVVALDARREDLALEDRGGHRRALQVLDRSSSASRPGAPPDDALPAREQAAEHRRIDRLDLLAQLRQRSPPDRLQDVRVAPLAAAPPGRNSPSSSRPAAASSCSSASAVAAAERVARGELERGERSVGARVAPREILRRIGESARAATRAGRPAAARRARRDSGPRTRPG